MSFPNEIDFDFDRHDEIKNSEIPEDVEEFKEMMDFGK